MTEFIEEPQYNNAVFAYEYTQRTLEKVNKTLDALTTKLAGVLGFSGVALKFAESLSDEGWLAYIKVAVCFFSGVAIWSCGLGLSPSSAGNVIDPESFLDPTIYRLSDEECKLVVIRQAIEGISELDQLIDQRRRNLNLAIVLVVLAGIGIAVSIGTKSLHF